MSGRILTRPDADAIRSYASLADDDFASADRFLDVVRESFERLARMPRMGSPRFFKAPELEGVRM